MKTPLMRTQVLGGPDGASTSPEIPHHKPGMFALLFVGARRIKQLTSFREERTPIPSFPPRPSFCIRCRANARVLPPTIIHSTTEIRPRIRLTLTLATGKWTWLRCTRRGLTLGKRHRRLGPSLNLSWPLEMKPSRLTKSAQQVFDEGQEFRNKAQQLRECRPRKLCTGCWLSAPRISPLE